ncbi:glycosyltransferase family protein [Solimonas soli]|uniref:glycosyltransferase family protein n=1 Tax=Solimonas soli TaxID=413479 RepID=UPI0004813650|nr:glycosyltransferase family protein [Solimonas soli]
MRIAYGVMGYGRGHAMRTMSVLPALQAGHDITVFAGGDAYEVLAPRFPTVRIPTIGYQYNSAGTHSLPKTVARNFAPMRDLLFGGPGSAQVEREMKARGIELVISDSEAWTHRAAQKLGIPRISFDHVGIIAYCKPHFPPDLWALGMRDAWGYRQLMGVPERILVSSFYPAEAAYPQVRIVGPMLRDEVVRETPRSGDYLLAYFNKGEHQYLPHVDRALRELDCRVIVYGTGLRGDSENLEFRAPSVDGFVRDLAHCRAVLSTAGNQLIGEAIHFGKPILALPEAAFEQRLNAHMIERMGVGQRGDLMRLTPSDIDRFLGNGAWHRSNMSDHPRDGRAQAIEHLQADIEALMPKRRAACRAEAAKPRRARFGQRAPA